MSGRASIVTVALVGVAVHIALVAPVIAHNNSDPAVLVRFTPDSPAHRAATDELGRTPGVLGDYGHDGERFWVVANDPLLLDETTPDLLDRPAYRAQRILYPALVSPATLLHPEAALWAMLVVNLAAVAAGTVITALLARDLGIGPWAGLLYALNPTVLFSLSHDLSDALAVASIVGVLWLLRRGRWAPAVALGTAAVLAKEPTGLALVGVVLLTRDLPAVVPRTTTARRVTLVLVPGAVAGAWGLYARWRLGLDGSGSQELSPVPFEGYVRALDMGWSPYGLWEDAAAAAVVVAVAVVTALQWWRRRTLELSSCLPFVALVPFLSSQVVFRQENSLRALGPTVTLLGLDFLAERRSSREATTRDDLSGVAD